MVQVAAGEDAESMVCTSSLLSQRRTPGKLGLQQTLTMSLTLYISPDPECRQAGLAAGTLQEYLGSASFQEDLEKEGNSVECDRGIEHIGAELHCVWIVISSLTGVEEGDEEGCEESHEEGGEEGEEGDELAHAKG